SLWRYHKKKGKLTKKKNIIFALNTIIIAGALIYVITQYICISPIECEMFMIILVLAAITTGLFVLVFKGMIMIEKTKAVMTYIGIPSQTGLAIKEIRSLTKKAEENLKKGDLEAAEILYEAIEPIYDSLEERRKRRVIGGIRKVYHELTTQKDGKDLNMRKNIENKEKEGF
ncbi:MAG: hypothetical protein ABIH63_01065, partial [archaeon]